MLGVVLTFIVGALVAVAFGYRDAASVTTIAAGTVTFIVGPVTGASVGASSAVIAISIATGVFKSIAVMLLTPMLAKKIGLRTAGSILDAVYVRNEDLQRPHLKYVSKDNYYKELYK